MRLDRFERSTPALGEPRSIQLSYRRKFKQELGVRDQGSGRKLICVIFLNPNPWSLIPINYNYIYFNMLTRIASNKNILELMISPH